MSEESKQYPVELRFQSELSLYGTSEYISLCCYEMELTIPSYVKHDGDQWRKVSKWFFDYSLWLDAYWGEQTVLPAVTEIGEGYGNRVTVNFAKNTNGNSHCEISLDEESCSLDVESAKKLIDWLVKFVAVSEKQKTP